MAETLNFGEAVQRAGISRHRLNEAIKSGRLPAVHGGGPGKPTTIQLEDLQAWCLSEGLAMPVETPERLERSQAEASNRAIAEAMGIDERTVRRDIPVAAFAADPPETTSISTEIEEAPAADAAPAPNSDEPIDNGTAMNIAPAPDKAAILHTLRTLQAEGFSLQAMADRFNTEGIPTLSGKGRWQKGTIGKLLTQNTTDS